MTRGLQKHPLSSRPSTTAIGNLDDSQYIVALEGNSIVFRIVGTLNGHSQEADSEIWVPQRELLTHIGRIGLFTADEVKQFEDLLNHTQTTEADFQHFFEVHPNFFRKWDYREVYPHVYLTREGQGPLIPDFILTNADAQEAAILDIKRTLTNPKKPLIRNQQNRLRFADVAQEACAQMRTYRRWFEVPDNQKTLKSKVGMEIYNPRLIVVIGRASEFHGQKQRATLRADYPDVEIVTYDDILRYAKERKVFVHGG